MPHWLTPPSPAYILMTEWARKAGGPPKAKAETSMVGKKRGGNR